MRQRKNQAHNNRIGTRVIKEQESTIGVEETVMEDNLLTDLISAGESSIFTSSPSELGEVGEMHYHHVERETADEEDPLSVSNDGLWQYLCEIARYPLLTPEHEQLLGLHLINAAEERQRPVNEQRRFIIEQGQKAARQLIESNLRLVVSIAKRYPRSTVSLLDSIQDGNLGLMRAVEKFDVRKGYRFSTYATWWIRQSVLRGLAEKEHTIRLPVYLVDILHRMYREGERLVQELGREPTEQEIASAMNLNPEKVHAAVKAINPISLQRPIGDDSNEAELGDFVPDPQMNPSDEAIRTVLHEQIQAVLGTLSAREQAVLTLCYGLEDGRSHSLKEIGQQFHLTRERIRQIESKAIRKLQQPYCRHLLQDALD